MPGRTELGACSSSISGRLLNVKGSRGEEHGHGSVVGLLDEVIIILVDAVFVAAPGEAAVGPGRVADAAARTQHLHRAAGRRRPADARQRGAPRSDTGVALGGRREDVAKVRPLTDRVSGPLFLGGVEPRVL